MIMVLVVEILLVCGVSLVWPAPAGQVLVERHGYWLHRLAFEVVDKLCS
jgi:hypothetical protein